MQLSCLSHLSRQPKADRQRHLWSFILRLSRLTSHLSLLTILFILLALAFAGPAFSQQSWERNFGGASTEWGSSAQQTSDGGYIVGGFTGTYPDFQFYLIKTDAFGDTLWTKTYGKVGRFTLEQCSSVQQTSDGGYILAGITGFYSSFPVLLIKTDPFGDTLWTKEYWGVKGYFVQQTSDGGYIVAGTTATLGNGEQVYLIKTNASGDTLWTKDYGGAGYEAYDEGYSVQQTSDTGYIVAGYTNSFGNDWEVYLIKTNAFGDTFWTRTYGGASWDRGNSVQQTSDGGYIVAGYTNSFGDSSQVYLIKTNSFGDTLWTKTFGGVRNEYGNSVNQTSDLGYIVAGRTTSFGNNEQVYLIKTDASGDTLWTRTYGGAGNDCGNSVQQTSDGGYIIGGYTNSFGNSEQVYLIKTDSLGRSSGVEEHSSSRLTPYASRLTVSPNPFTSFASIPGHSSERFALYDVSGRKVGVYKGDRVGAGLSAGVYFLKPESGDAKPFRIVKLR